MATPRINKLTGLPFGFRPGDSVESLNVAGKKKATESLAAQSQAARSMAAPAPAPAPATPLPPRGPASQRETVTPTPNRSVTPPPSQKQSASVAQYEAALKDYQSGLSKSGGNADADRARFGRLQQIYNNADEMSRIGMSNVTMRRASAVNQAAAAASPYGGQAPRVGGQGSTVGSKVVGIRPATEVIPRRKSRILKRRK